jgi:hypothetical protein
MNSIKPALLTYVLPLVLALAVAMGYSQYGRAQSGSQLYLCKMPYALCTSARCVPHPNPFHKNQAICSCDVERGPNMAAVPCSQLQPRVVDGHHVLYSTYSFVQYYQGRQSMICPSGNPWTNCLDMRCTVDPLNPRKAICVCDIMRTGEFTTVGGHCNTATCKNAYWSGATLFPRITRAMPSSLKRSI